MRAVAAVVALLALVLAGTSPVNAHPFPQTRSAVEDAVHDTLTDLDASAADLILLARDAIEDAQGSPTPFPALPLPGMPAALKNGELEVRAAMVQPGIQGQDEVLAVLWIGAKSGHWTGAYWATSDDGVKLPNILDVDEEGLLLFLSGGANSMDAQTKASYHFLGIDGKYAEERLDPVPLLADIPILDRAAVSGADASTRGATPEALIIAPWNLFDHNATIGMTLLSGDSVLEDIVVAGCEAPEATQTEGGCRLLYVLMFDPAITALQMWHLDDDGHRVIDEEHSRTALETGFHFTP